MFSLCQVVAQVMGKGSFRYSPSLVKYGNDAGRLGIHYYLLWGWTKKLQLKNTLLIRLFFLVYGDNSLSEYYLSTISDFYDG